MKFTVNATVLMPRKLHFLTLYWILWIRSYLQSCILRLMIRHKLRYMKSVFNPGVGRGGPVRDDGESDGGGPGRARRAGMEIYDL